MSQFHGVIETGPDGQGRHHFLLYWHEANGVFRPEPSKDGDGPVGYRRGQCFHARREEYLDVVWHPTEQQAKAAAWAPHTGQP